MSDSDLPASSRDLGRADFKRAPIVVVIMSVVGGAYWFMLPIIRSRLIPDTPGGVAGPWVVRPIQAFHFGAAAVSTCVTAPCLLGPLRRRWRREDDGSGTRYDPYRGRPLMLARAVIAGMVILSAYAASLFFYLSSWTIIGPDGIEQHLPWATLHHPFRDVERLETIPDGERSESIKEDGPWYDITLRGGRSITLSPDNEGATPGELSAIAAFVADRSNLSWKRRPDARAR